MNGTPVIFKVIEELCASSFSVGPIGIVPPALGRKEPVGVVKSHIAYGIRTHCLPAQFLSATITAPRLPVVVPSRFSVLSNLYEVNHTVVVF